MIIDRFQDLFHHIQQPLVDIPVRLGRKADVGAIAPPQEIGLAVCCRAAVSQVDKRGAVVVASAESVRLHILHHSSHDASDLVLDALSIRLASRVLGFHPRLCLPFDLVVRNICTNVFTNASCVRAHVLGHELVPRLFECFIKSCLVLRKLFHNCVVFLVCLESNVTGKHHDLWEVGFGAVDLPLVLSRWAGIMHPRMRLKVFEIIVVPHEGSLGPSTMIATRVMTFQAQAWPGAVHILAGWRARSSRARPVGPPEGVTTTDQRHSLLIVEVLEAKNPADLISHFLSLGSISHGTARVHVYHAHFSGPQRGLAVARFHTRISLLLRL
mmetsp:Transcript_52036/g.106060  ORF Transcript_52036/g.106060 Transcript_52036/m.106060 type:complete len:327 (+) Transcript_52036:1063-2043(+)